MFILILKNFFNLIILTGWHRYSSASLFMVFYKSESSPFRYYPRYSWVINLKLISNFLLRMLKNMCTDNLPSDILWHLVFFIGFYFFFHLIILLFFRVSDHYLIMGIFKIFILFEIHYFWKIQIFIYINFAIICFLNCLYSINKIQLKIYNLTGLKFNGL